MGYLYQLPIFDLFGCLSRVNSTRANYTDWNKILFCEKRYLKYDCQEFVEAEPDFLRTKSSIFFTLLKTSGVVFISQNTTVYISGVRNLTFPLIGGFHVTSRRPCTWHDLRNGIIMRNDAYAKLINKFKSELLTIN